jgi:hypothetical protein
MRLALAGTSEAVSGAFEYRNIGEGFEVADIPVIVEGQTVDHIMLARIDLAKFRFVVRNAPDGGKTLDEWMHELGATLVVNGSYFSRFGTPDTPFISEGVSLGPEDYDAKSGAFITSAHFTGIRDLANEDWKTAFQGADNAMVSYPLLVSQGENRVTRQSRWLANRSFIGQDASGRIIIGTTTDGFFTLDHLARFLLKTPIGLKLALNLDGGPVACQGISLNGYERKSYGRWEAQADGDNVHLLTWPYGTWGMPIILAVFPK